MTDYWTNFAKTGDPNGPGLPTWPQYEPATEPTLTLDDEVGVPSATTPHSARCSTLRAFSFDRAFAHGQKRGLFDFLP